MSYALRFLTDPIPMVQNDTKPVLNVYVKDTADPPAPVDITGWQLTFVFKKKTDAAYRFKRDLFHIDSVNGIAGLNWKEGDTAIAGKYNGRITVTFPDGTRQSQVEPFEFDVAPAYDAVSPISILTPEVAPGLPFKESITSQITTANLVFTLTHKFVSGTLQVYLNGLEQGISGLHFQENLDQRSLTFLDILPLPNDEIYVVYIIEEL